MNWNNLKSMKCPKDGKLLEKHDSLYSHSGCDFKIHHKKFDEIVSKMYSPVRHQMNAIEDNLSMLNNFGHKMYSEDYSDEIKRLSDN